jgi:hypothetical protein
MIFSNAKFFKVLGGGCLGMILKIAKKRSFNL